MKNIKVLLSAFLLSLVSLNFVYAENSNIAGEWDITKSWPATITAQTTIQTSSSLGGDVDTQTSTTQISPPINSNMIITQYPDGRLSGSVQEIDGNGTSLTTSLQGSIYGNSMGFTLRTTKWVDHSINGVVTDVNVTELQGSFYGSLSGNTITGTSDWRYMYDSSYYRNEGQIYIHEESFASGYGRSFSVPIIIKEIPVVNPPQDTQNGKQKDKNNAVGEPINSVTGNMYIVKSDLNIPGKGLNFTFERTYNSQAASQYSENGPLGYGWTHSYNLYLTEDTTTHLVKIKEGQAKGYLFLDNQDGTFTPQRGEYSTLTKTSSDFIWRKKDGKQYIFDLNGKLTQINDRNNNTINLTYNSLNQLTLITDTAGRQINLTYTQGKIGSIRDPLSRNFTYNYDTLGNLISTIDPMSYTTTYMYDSRHNLTKMTDPNNRSIYYTYDSQNRCTSSSGENNAGRVNLTFDPANNKTVILDSKSNTSINYYNTDLLITKVVDAQGNAKNFTWDNYLNLTSQADELGYVTNMEYDAHGNLAEVIDSNGNATTFVYEPNFNLLQAVTDAQGNFTTYSRDSFGNSVQITDAYGSSVYNSYNEAGQVISTQNVLGNTTNFSYDSQGNLIQVADVLSNTTIYNYDGVGNLLQSKNAKGYTSNFTYNNLNQLTKVTYPDTAIIAYTYDGVGNRISLTNALGFVTSYTYDQFQRITSIRDALGHVVSKNYDSEGNLISLVDQNNNQTTYAYDSLNRLISQIDPLGNKAQYTYDIAGNPVSYIDAKGKTVLYTYDNLNRLVKTIYPDSQVSYTYDSLGRRISITDSQGTTNYNYDKLGRLTQVDGPISNDTVTYTYDKAGNRLSLIDPDGKITVYTYDALNRLSSVTDPQNQTTTYSYDVLGNLTNLTYPNNVKTSYTYDNLNRLLSLTEKQNAGAGAALASFAYTYDKLGRKTQSTLLDGSQIKYTYDALGELTGEVNVSTVNPYQISYTYDFSGNRTKMINRDKTHTYSYNSDNQLIEENIQGLSTSTTKITVTGKVSDTNGVKQVTINGVNAVISGGNFSGSATLNVGVNTITVIATDNLGASTTKLVHVSYDPTNKIIYTYDNNGNLIKKARLDKSTNFTYDTVNRLTHLTSVGLDETYQYDGEGKRIAATSNSIATNYLYDGLNVISERNSSNVTTSSYIRNPEAPGGIGGIVSQQSAAGIPTYYHYDGLGSVVNLTNASATVSQTYSYDAFGNVIAQSGTSNNTHKFLTKETSSSGLVYFGYRYYDPKIGRFITQDPAEMIDGPNRYTYCLNDPVNVVDLWGLYGEKKKAGFSFCPRYGNWGGLDWSGGSQVRAGEIGPDIDPVDQMDSYFKTHDIAGYIAYHTTSRSLALQYENISNLQLYIDLRSLSSDPKLWNPPAKNVFRANVYRKMAEMYLLFTIEDQE